MTKKINILEATLRDGSYIVKDQFTAKDTAFIAQSLDEIGIEYIEIGPGIGMNAKVNTGVIPASEDIDYIRNTRDVVKRAKIGMFFIPGIGRIEDIKLAADEGLDFIRIGININEYKEAIKYISYARNRGLMTTINFMKSYVVSPNTFASYADQMYGNGVDVVYLVDSAGGMLPTDVEQYIKETKNRFPEIKLGFHGHNNLSLAMANTLTAIEQGAEFVDSTIRGMGRSSGNTITEKLVLILDRLDYKHNINIDRLLTLSENTMLPYLMNRYESTTDYILGYAQFHSSYLKSIYNVANKFNVDPNKLIIEYAKTDKVSMDEKRLEILASTMSKQEHMSSSFNVPFSIKQSHFKDIQFKILKNKFVELKSKYNHVIYFNITKSYVKNTVMKISPVVHSIHNIIFGSAELSAIDNDFEEIYSYFKDTVDGFLVDLRLYKPQERSTLMKQHEIDDKVLLYNDGKLFSKSIYNYLKHIKMKDSSIYKMYVDIYEEVYEYLKPMINDMGITIVNKFEDAQIIVGTKTYLTAKDIIDCKELQWILLITPGNLDPKIAHEYQNINLIRIDLEREIVSEIMENSNYTIMFGHKFGTKEIKGKYYCSGGFIGEEGTIIVDNINNISKVYGVSRGDGSINYDH